MPRPGYCSPQTMSTLSVTKLPKLLHFKSINTAPELDHAWYMICNINQRIFGARVLEGKDRVTILGYEGSKQGNS